LRGIAWIENLLNNGEGIANSRKKMVDLVIAPYLINIKQCDYDIANSKTAEWLDKCGRRIQKIE
jgi:Primase X